MPVGRMSLRKQHTLLFMDFSFSPIKPDFAFSHYWGEGDKDLCLICKRSSSHSDFYYPCKKTAFRALNPLAICFHHMGYIHLYFVQILYSITTRKGKQFYMIFLAICSIEFLFKKKKILPRFHVKEFK